jgi:hypothetical protein
VALHHWGIDYGQAQLRLIGLQKDELLDQVLALPLSIFLLPVGISCPVEQALEVHFGHVRA